MFSYLFKIIKENTIYDGFLPVKEYIVKHQLFAGGWSREVRRECQLRRGGVVAVLPYDPQRDQVVLIEQFRVGALARQHNPWLLETIAGVVEPGETSAEVAHRESQEEAGCALLALEKISDYYSTPGGTSEKVVLYCARTDTSAVGGIHGLAEEGEDIKTHALDRSEAMSMLARGDINTAPAIIALQWLALNYQRLQADWR